MDKENKGEPIAAALDRDFLADEAMLEVIQIAKERAQLLRRMRVALESRNTLELMRVAELLCGLRTREMQS